MNENGEFVESDEELTLTENIVRTNSTNFVHSYVLTNNIEDDYRISVYQTFGYNETRKVWWRVNF